MQLDLPGISNHVQHVAAQGGKHVVIASGGNAGIATAYSAYQLGVIYFVLFSFLFFFFLVKLNYHCLELTDNLFSPFCFQFLLLFFASKIIIVRKWQFSVKFQSTSFNFSDKSYNFHGVWPHTSGIKEVPRSGV